MTIPQNMLQDSKVIWTEALLRFADIDSYGHVSNQAFAEIFEGGRIDFIARRIEPWISDRVFVVIARLTIDFWNELTFPGGARTGTWISNVGRTSATIDQVLLGDNGIVGAATGICVLVEKATRRPSPFQDELRQSLQAMCNVHYADEISTLSRRHKAGRKSNALAS
jgi:acyl-CoA thioester hydrolase